MNNPKITSVGMAAALLLLSALLFGERAEADPSRAIGQLLLELGLSATEAVVLNKKAEESLVDKIALQYFFVECEKKGGPEELGASLAEECPFEQGLEEGRQVGRESVAELKRCYSAADRLPSGDETIEERNRCLYEVQALDRELAKYYPQTEG